MVDLGLTGLTRDADHNYFVEANLPSGEHVTYPGPTDRPLISVTNSIKSVNKADPLMAWAKREVAKAAVAHHEQVGQMIAASGADATAQWLQTIPGYRRDSAAVQGTRIHSCAEQIFLGHPYEPEPEMVEPYGKLVEFNATFTPRVVWVERMVVNLTHLYAGTLDLLAWLPTGATGEWELWLLDIKSGQKEVYKENGLQLAGLNGAEYAGAPGNPQLEPMQKAQRFGIILLKPNWRLVEVFPSDANGSTDEKLAAAYKGFLHARYLQEWLVDKAPRSVGTTVKPPKESK